MDTIDEAFLRAFARQIGGARSDLRLSREELAELAAIHPNTVGIAERADRDLNALTQTRILAALGCAYISLADDRYDIHFQDASLRPTRDDILGMHDSSIVRYIGAAIRERRQALGLRIADVSARAGLHPNSVWNCEMGLVCPAGCTLFRIYRALDAGKLVAGAEGMRLG